MLNFGEILTRSWKIIWKYKILWLFGLLASLGAGGGNGGGGSNFNFNSRNGQNPFTGPNTQNMPLWAQRMMESIGIWLPILILLILVLIAVLIVLNTFGRIGLYRGAWLADEGAERLTLNQLWQAGKHYFWRVFLLILLIWALSLTLGLIIIIPTVGLTLLTFGIGLICLIPLLCVLAIFLWALTILADMAVIAIVNEDLGVINSIRRAWAVFTARPADVIIMALILWIGGLVVGLIIGLPVLLIAAPILGSIFLQSQQALRGGMILSIVLFLIYLPVLLFAESLVQSYLSTAWTLVFRRITGRQPGVASPQVVNVTPESNL